MEQQMLKEKVAIITGASYGMGQTMAELFAEEGAAVVLTARGKDKLDAVVEGIRQNGGKAVGVIADVCSTEDTKRVFKTALKEFGDVDILINNAGISYIGLLTDMSIDDWNRIVSTNLTSVFSTSRLAIPHMVHEKKGKIINISSVWGIAGASCEVAYSACKGGINSFTKALAKELAPSNIQVNAIACGVIDTQMNACFSEEERAELADEIPAGRFGTPEETAHLAVQLATGNEYLTGQIITLDGGWL